MFNEMLENTLATPLGYWGAVAAASILGLLVLAQLVAAFTKSEHDDVALAKIWTRLMSVIPFVGKKK